MYNELYKAWRSERTSTTPQPLPPDFYQRVTAYLKGLEQDSAFIDMHALQGRLLAKEREVSARLLGELRETRLTKIVEAAKNGNTLNLADLTEEEKALVEKMNQSLASYKRSRHENKVDASLPEAETALTVVRFLQDVPEIVGVDLRIYGPYKKEDVGSLPSANAQALIGQGAAKLIEVRGVASARSVA